MSRKTKDKAARTGVPAPPQQDWLAPLIERRWLLLAALAVLLIPRLVFNPLADASFLSVGDPTTAVGRSEYESGIAGPAFRHAFTSLDAGAWQPVAWLSQMLDIEMHGATPAGHHATSLWMHGLNSTLLFALCFALSGAIWPSLIAGLGFAVHPQHAEAAGWLLARHVLAGAFFSLIAALAWIRWGRGGFRPWYAVALAAGLLALGSSPSAAGLPVVLLLLPSEAKPMSRRLLELSPLLAMSAVTTAVAFIAGRAGEALGQAGGNLGMYLLHTVWPARMSYQYPDPIPAAVIFGGLGAVLAISAALLLLRRDSRATAAWVAFLCLLAPVLGFTLADRLMYIPHLALAAASSFLLFELAPLRFWRVAGAIAMLGIGVLAWAGWVEAHHWVDDLSLFTRSVRLRPRDAAAHRVLGNAFVQLRERDKAAAHLKKALELAPEAAENHRNMAEFLYVDQQYEDSLAAIDRAIAIDPKDAFSHHSRGMVLRKMKRNVEAIDEFQKALDLGVAPQTKAKTLFEMGLAYNGEKKPGRAEPLFREILAENPNDYIARKNLAFALMNQGKTGQAAMEFSLLKSVNPGDPDVIDSIKYLQQSKKK